jgi:hypothetical protein
MKKFLLTGIAALLLATGAAHTEEWQPKRRHLVCDERGCTYEFGNSDAYEKAQSHKLWLKWLKNYVTPPEEFDHEYLGEMTVIRMSEADINLHCLAEKAMLGCAFLQQHLNICTVYILDDDGLQTKKEEYDSIYRHERAHCNGWKHKK